MATRSSRGTEKEVFADEATSVFVNVTTAPEAVGMDPRTRMLLDRARAEPRARAFLRYSPIEAAERSSRAAVTLPDARRRARLLRTAVSRRRPRAVSLEERLLERVPLFFCGFLAAFFAATSLLLSPIGGQRLQRLVAGARHTVSESFERTAQQAVVVRTPAQESR
jgi:hypothetical protein